MNEFELMQFSNGIVLNGELISRICSKVLKEIENGLPEEARIYEVYVNIIDICKETLQEKKIVL